MVSYLFLVAFVSSQPPNTSWLFEYKNNNPSKAFVCYCIHVCIHTQHLYGGLTFYLYINLLASSSQDLKFMYTSGGTLAQSLFKAEGFISSRFASGWKNLHSAPSYRLYRSCLPSFCVQALKEIRHCSTCVLECHTAHKD